MLARLIALALLLAVALAPTASAQGGPPASLPDLEDEVMCPTCGVTLALSEAPQANQIRDQIRGYVAEGMSKEQVKAALVDEYGSEVLATPGSEGFDLVAWLAPIAGLLVGAVALLVGVRRWRPPGAGSAEPAAAVPSGSDEERLRADLRRYEL
jgi:cytochrome c-type biogenesis protein CcmH